METTVTTSAPPRDCCRYKKNSDALMAITCLDGTSLDERIIKVGIDPGFKAGRQYGRGSSGGQVGGTLPSLLRSTVFVP